MWVQASDQHEAEEGGGADEEQVAGTANGREGSHVRHPRRVRHSTSQVWLVAWEYVAGRDRVPLDHSQAADATCPARHCWVTDSVDGWAALRPGVLVEWRQAVGGPWQWRVPCA